MPGSVVARSVEQRTASLVLREGAPSRRLSEKHPHVLFSPRYTCMVLHSTLLITLLHPVVLELHLIFDMLNAV